MSPTPVSAFDKAKILSEALPYMQSHDDATIVIKYGGHAMGNEQVARNFARDVVLLEQAGHQSRRRAWRRAADLGDAEAPRHQVGVRRRPSHHRP